MSCLQALADPLSTALFAASSAGLLPDAATAVGVMGLCIQVRRSWQHRMLDDLLLATHLLLRFCMFLPVLPPQSALQVQIQTNMLPSSPHFPNFCLFQAPVKLHSRAVQGLTVLCCCCLQITNPSYMIPSSFGSATSVRVANLLGGGLPRKARTATG